MKNSIDVSATGFLSFRIAQEYDELLNPMGSDVDFDIKISTSSPVLSASVSASNYQLLSFPVVLENFSVRVSSDKSYKDSVTKNAMRTYVIPLSDFPIADFSHVSSIEFNFTNTTNIPGKDFLFVIDDVEFIY